MLGVSDVERSVTFYRDVLRFNVLVNLSDYAAVEWEEATSYLHPADEEVLG